MFILILSSHECVCIRTRVYVYGNIDAVSESNFFQKYVSKSLHADMWRHVIWWRVTKVSKKLLPPSSEWLLYQYFRTNYCIFKIIIPNYKTGILLRTKEPMKTHCEVLKSCLPMT
jgi:hypothetical protein